LIACLACTQALQVLHGAIPQMLAWLGVFRRPEPDQAAGAVDLGWEAGWEAVCVNAVVDIEESVWAPRYGLKGIIDASVQLRFQQLPGSRGGGALPQVQVL
jgi:DNA replication ATP-dependent helicase Dna2